MNLRMCVVLALPLAACTGDTYLIPIGESSGAEPTTTNSGEQDTSTGEPSSSSSTGIADSSDTADATTTDGCVPTDGADQWWRSEWAHRRRLEIDTSIFDGPVTDLPVLLRLDADALGDTWATREGADLRFRGDPDAPLAYDIDDIDADGTLFLWLALPEIEPSPEPMTVWMYYGNPGGRADPDLAESVWAEHISVHHLGSDLRDSANANDGSSPWPPELCDGECGPRIGIARHFDPELLHEVIFDGHQSYDLGVSPYHPAVMEFTVSVWMRAGSLADYPWGPLIAKGDDTWRIHASSYPDDLPLSEKLSFGFDCQPGDCPRGPFDEFNNANLVGLTTVDDNQWHHVAITLEIVDEPKSLPPGFTPDVMARIYIDGEEAAEPIFVEQFLLPEDDQPVRLAHNINNGRRWRGDLDEVRVVARNRSAVELAADYATVVNDHIAIGEEQTVCP